jgi:carbamoyltransferase
MAELYLGMARARLGPAAALIDMDRGVVAACEENRLTRARQAPTSGPPALALTELLGFLDRAAGEIARVGIVIDEEDIRWAGVGSSALQIDGHQAHARYAFHASGFSDAIVLVSEVHKPRGWTAWRFGGVSREPKPVGERLGDFPLAKIYGQLTEALGLQRMRDEHLVESMARAGSDTQPAIADMVTLRAKGVAVHRHFDDAIQQVLAASDDPDATRRDIAASVQRRLGECLVALLQSIAEAERSGDGPRQRLCLSGGLFFNTFFTTAAAACPAFEQVFVPPHPGRNGAALGAALDAAAAGAESSLLPIGSPYAGPGFSDSQIKEALDNCKLSYDFQQGDRLNEAVIHALSRGRLVGWFHGRLEWGPRALGHRSVLADPFAPHALENLNGFLKRRPWYRSYGVSVPLAQADQWFEPLRGGESLDRTQGSPFMQFEYRPRDPDKFGTILPAGVRTLRVHTVDDSEPRYLRLLEMWGEKTGTPVLVNTSFNGFHEPLVCSPRDAIRVFYGTGLDVLALEDFLLHK